MTDYPLQLEDIVSWFRARGAALEGSTITLVDVMERTKYVPAAAADFLGTHVAGRINGWVSGEFDFEAVRISDSKDIFRRSLTVLTLEALDITYREFLAEMERLDSVPSPEM